jgi:hypothetical protein
VAAEDGGGRDRSPDYEDEMDDEDEEQDEADDEADDSSGESADLEDAVARRKGEWSPSVLYILQIAAGAAQQGLSLQMVLRSKAQRALAICKRATLHVLCV